MDSGFYDYGEAITAVDACYERPRLNAMHVVIDSVPRVLCRLLQATVDIYGAEATRRIYGEVPAVAPERILERPEGARIALAGREFSFIDAPGHARHHVVVRDARTGGDLRHSFRAAHRRAPPRRRPPPAVRRARPARAGALREIPRAEALRQGWQLSESEVMAVFKLAIELNAQGLEAWLDSHSAARAARFPSEKR